jgi:hypothetical protein
MKTRLPFFNLPMASSAVTRLVAGRMRLTDGIDLLSERLTLVDHHGGHATGDGTKKED